MSRAGPLREGLAGSDSFGYGCRIGNDYRLIIVEFGSASIAHSDEQAERYSEGLRCLSITKLCCAALNSVDRGLRSEDSASRHLHLFCSASRKKLHRTEALCFSYSEAAVGWEMIIRGKPVARLMRFQRQSLPMTVTLSCLYII